MRTFAKANENLSNVFDRYVLQKKANDDLAKSNIFDRYLQVADVSVWHVINTSTNERKLKSIDEIQSEIRDRTMKSFTRVVSDILY
jgi:hypothetical protein